MAMSRLTTTENRVTGKRHRFTGAFIRVTACAGR
jgi:hypothetical protein